MAAALQSPTAWTVVLLAAFPEEKPSLTSQLPNGAALLGHPEQTQALDLS